MALKTHGADASEADSGIVAEINITPLTDIFLVLLIIFMVTSSVMSQMGVDVKLPKASQASSTSQPEGVVITLLPDGSLRVNQDETRIEAGNYSAMESRLKELFQKTNSRLVILEGDRQAFLGAAVEVMDHATRAGASQFAIATAQ